MATAGSPPLPGAAANPPDDEERPSATMATEGTPLLSGAVNPSDHEDGNIMRGLKKIAEVFKICKWPKKNEEDWEQPSDKEREEMQETNDELKALSKEIELMLLHEVPLWNFDLIEEYLQKNVDMYKKHNLNGRKLYEFKFPVLEYEKKFLTMHTEKEEDDKCRYLTYTRANWNDKRPFRAKAHAAFWKNRNRLMTLLDELVEFNFTRFNEPRNRKSPFWGNLFLQILDEFIDARKKETKEKPRKLETDTKSGEEETKPISAMMLREFAWLRQRVKVKVERTIELHDRGVEFAGVTSLLGKTILLIGAIVISFFVRELCVHIKDYYLESQAEGRYIAFISILVVLLVASMFLLERNQELNRPFKT